MAKEGGALQEGCPLAAVLAGFLCSVDLGNCPILGLGGKAFLSTVLLHGFLSLWVAGC